MRILWLTNIALADACRAAGCQAAVIGGWMEGYLRAYQAAYGTADTLCIASPAPTQATAGQRYEVNGVSYRFFEADEARLPQYLRALADDFRPDIVHLHGTELPHALAWMKACPDVPSLVSIQGLTSVCCRYFLGGITEPQQRAAWSLNDFLYRRTLQHALREMQARGAREVAVLQAAQHVAGRTTWDAAHVRAINPSVHYHTLQEVLRPIFYDETHTWHLEAATPHTLFMSQTHFPLKGMHQLLQALPLILRRFPDTQVRALGVNPLTMRWYNRTTYQNVLRQLLRPVASHVNFLGFLSAEAMRQEYLSAALFVSPSAIENSSNSICEAQRLGCPVVASYVGGTPSLITDGVTGLLYRYEEVEMLADLVCECFAHPAYASRLGAAAREVATRRHDPTQTARSLHNLYQEIAQS